MVEKISAHIWEAVRPQTHCYLARPLPPPPTTTHSPPPAARTSPAAAAAAGAVSLAESLSLQTDSETTVCGRAEEAGLLAEHRAAGQVGGGRRGGGGGGGGGQGCPCVRRRRKEGGGRRLAAGEEAAAAVGREGRGGASRPVCEAAAAACRAHWFVLVGTVGTFIHSDSDAET